MKIPDSVSWKRVGDPLGIGGQGNVHPVVRKDDPEGPTFALKKLNKTNSEKARDRFQREIEAVKTLDHPNIIRIIDYSSADADFQYYVMECPEDPRTLSDLIFSSCNPFYGDALRSLDLFEQIVSAIGACEECQPQVFHRDIKPDNILVLKDGSIRLIDFGICHFDDGNMITLTDEGVGARDYTAPECESGNSDRPIGIHSDLYSAAKVLWTAITSQKAFAREQPVFRHRSMKEMFPERTETWHLTSIFEKTIREAPEDRFQSTHDVLCLIREVRYLIQQGFPPLEDVGERCPSCGRKDVKKIPDSHSVFGYIRRVDFVSYQCNSCGLALLRNKSLLEQNVGRTKDFD